MGSEETLRTAPGQPATSGAPSSRASLGAPARRTPCSRRGGRVVPSRYSSRGSLNVVCPSCGTENPADKRFCGDCGAPLASGCPTCGALNPPGKRFCGDCGTALGGAAAAVVGPAAATAPVAERRVVSILFADLVGFTTLAEGSDAEDTRELLSRYFDLARDVIGRYGGTVEKFIGDAVMAVWGAPTAREDDAERAVRAALELVDAVRSLGPQVSARAGVLTGEAAVTLGATNQGMVAGDLVNTASRLQSVAAPGHGPRRRGDPARGSPGDRLRARRRADPQGQGRAGRSVAGAAGRRRGRRPQPVRDASRPRSSAATRSSACSRTCSTPPAASDGSRLVSRHRVRRHRQEPPRLGVPQVRRRAARHRLVARRSQPRLWRRDQLLGARRDGPRPRRPGRDRRRGDDPSQDRRHRASSGSRTRSSGAGSSRRS